MKSDKINLTICSRDLKSHSVNEMGEERLERLEEFSSEISESVAEIVIKAAHMVDDETQQAAATVACLIS